MREAGFRHVHFFIHQLPLQGWGIALMATCRWSQLLAMVELHPMPTGRGWVGSALVLLEVGTGQGPRSWASHECMWEEAGVGSYQQVLQVTVHKQQWASIMMFFLRPPKGSNKWNLPIIPKVPPNVVMGSFCGVPFLDAVGGLGRYFPKTFAMQTLKTHVGNHAAALQVGARMSELCEKISFLSWRVERWHSHPSTNVWHVSSSAPYFLLLLVYP